MDLRRPAGQTTFPTLPDDVESISADAAPAHPLRLLEHWIDGAVRRDVLEPMYVTLATASANGVPSSRTVQLLGVEDDALLLTTNLGSRKGVEMLETGRAAISAYWRETAQSVNVTGRVVIAEDAENDARFAADSRAVQASRTVSFHGRPLDDEAAQLRAFERLLEDGEPIPRPDYWIWYRLVPDAVTFWEGHAGSLNRRLHYALRDGAWVRGRVQA
ncbi:pyridoxamine 5'-phosphate oxidase family protein [Galbitalea sp. SE-J8]|uniref:pyridoxine/pyridoxamine 5'-phosphate oxidase n=1 Tax=Galbitalea sp. SE-J8 TaxID=3054952 RepID=UPI00259C9760|nr:pyridoxamine 5'-phosphate oxidase family protein [Galbitalea sp. SE-J8]MDM4764063.1 pyridoxamine 5'-phosphate oxidase family protein [Galbitalea sp. SE-J8]